MAALAGVCAAAAIVGLADLARERRHRGSGAERHQRADGAERRQRASGADRPRRPLTAAVRTLTVLAGRALGRRAAPPRDLQARLDAAGAPPHLTVADVMALKCGAALAGALVAVPAASLAPGRLGPVVLLALPVAGFWAPDHALRRRARRRAARLERELPDVAELLRVAVDAGLPPTRALAEVGRRHPGVLAAELATVAARTHLGVPHDDALRALARSAPVPGVAQLTAALRRAARHGAPIGPVLAAIAADARAQRTRALSDRAARAAPQIQLVVALLLVPAVLLLVASGLAAALI